MNRRVSALVRGWKPVSRVSIGSASGVTRWAMAFEKVCSAAYTRTWMSVGFQALVAAMSSGQADDPHTRSVIARMRT